MEIHGEEKIETQNSKSEAVKTTSLADELDNLMDISIEIASNKRMKKDYIKPFKLTFKDKEMEKKVMPELILSQLWHLLLFLTASMKCIARGL